MGASLGQNTCACSTAVVARGLWIADGLHQVYLRETHTHICCCMDSTGVVTRCDDKLCDAHVMSCHAMLWHAVLCEAAKRVTARKEDTQDATAVLITSHAKTWFTASLCGTPCCHSTALTHHHRTP